MKSVACVTGAASGIGLAVAAALVEMGFCVLVVDMKDENEAGEALKAMGEGCVYVRADISDGDGRKRILDAVGSRGRLDLLVNNAGVAPNERRDILDSSEESYDRVMGINLKGPFFLTQALAKYMLELIEGKVISAARIVNVASISTYTSSINRPEYCLSKAGVSMMTKLYADRLAGHGINVYELRPGIIRTPMTDSVTQKYDKMINEDGLLPIPRWGTPQDVAHAVMAIAEGHFDYSTGQVFDIDGGFHLRRL